MQEKEMPYVTRNSDGIIQGVYDSPSESNSQWMEMQSPEVMEFSILSIVILKISAYLFYQRPKHCPAKATGRLVIISCN